MKLRPTSVAVVVKDRKRAAKWYKEKLGLKVLADDGEHWTVVGRPKTGLQLHLCETDGRRGPNEEEADTGILLVVDRSIPKAFKTLSKRGVDFEMEPKETPWGWSAKIRDPDGNVLWLQEE